MNNKTLVIIIDPKGIIAGDFAARERHESYAKTLNSVAPNFKLLIATAFPKLDPNLAGINRDLFLQVRSPSRNFISFSYKLSRVLKSDFIYDNYVVVAGDPWENFLAAYLLKLIFPGNVHSQVQIHAEIANSKWFKSGARNRFKFLSAAAGFYLANQIRTVSRHQADEIVQKYKLNPKKVKVIPPPLQLAQIHYYSNPPRPETIGFVGRMDNDRGTSDLIKLAIKLNEVNSLFKIVLVGNGPELSNLEKELARIVGENRILSLGKLQARDLQVAFMKIGVLVSLSQTESYGRTIRESFALGVPVWSTPTSGMKEFKFEVKSNALEYIDLTHSPDRLNSQFQILLGTKVDGKYGEKMREKDQQNIVKLCESWIELIGNKRRIGNHG